MGKLILIRHGQSMWNKLNVFTGWVDVPLSEEGVYEALEAGEMLKDISFDAVFTSVQIRAIETAMLCLSKNRSGKTPVIFHESGKMRDWTEIYNDNIKEAVIPVYQDWHLNERYYGKLQGLNKAETAAEFGTDQVHIWRRSYDVPPPDGESLKVTVERTIPYFQDVIMPLVYAGKNVLVSAHGNSLRSIVMKLDKLTEDTISELEIPTGRPLIYELNGSDLLKV
ncbi:MAG: 2,3-bisphosphoglycerate-dependent phosphoglycerate mutase [Spirochaetes bacterium]|nr:2,3-bisphosphoglycerate-dependent phosphoglycerate mutase [Spirochaetota bacterium]